MKRDSTNFSGRVAAWSMPLLALAVGMACVVSYPDHGESHAGPGSPYYDAAVKQAIAGLLNSGTGHNPAPAAQAPPPNLPPGAYWCEKCKQYHLPKEAPQPIAPAPAPANASPPASAADPSIPPLPVPYDPAEYSWCPQCKAYHRRNAPVHNPPSN